MSEDVVERAKREIRKWASDPVAMVRELLGAEPDEWQIDALSAISRVQRVAMKACKGPGKTTVLAWAMIWFLLTRAYPKIVATSISGDNLRDGLWSELLRWIAKAPLLQNGFDCSATRVSAKTVGENWFAVARQWSKSADRQSQADTLAGVHADHVLFVVDEAGGVPDAVMAAAEGALATGRETKLMIAGNPTHLEGPLYRACTRERHLWHVVEISGDPDDPKRAKRISIQWAREQIEKWGRENPYVVVNVFGRFPPASINSLLGPDEVAEAMRRHAREEEFAHAQRRLGVDVAGFGDDRTVIFPRQGLVAFKPVVMRGVRPSEVAARVMRAKADWGAEIELVDCTGGYGEGVVDALIQAGQAPISVQFAGRPTRPSYRNKRAEMWFEMAEWIKRGGILPNDPELARELTAVTYFLREGKFQLEEKVQIKERLGVSPDLADALACTFAVPEAPGVHMIPEPLRPSVGRMQWDYDPFSSERMEATL